MLKDTSHLIKKRVLVTRGNKTFYQTVYVSPEGHEEKETPIGGEIADLEGLKIIQYSDKSVLISGDTFKHLEVLRDLKNQLGIGSWNKALNGWVFPSVHKDTILGKFVSILGKELEQEQEKKKDNHLFSAFEEQLEIEIHNTIQEKNVIPIDTKVKTTKGNGIIVGHENGIYKIELDDKVRTYWLEETEFEVLPASVEVTQTILENATPENRFGAEKQIEGKPILDEKKEEEYNFTPDNIKITTPSGEVVDVIDFSKALPKYLINIPSEENILNVDKPSYVPDVDENLIKRRNFILNFVQLENDKFLVQTHDKPTPLYATVNLDGLVVTHEYYKRKAQAVNDKQASEQSERTVSRWKNMSDDNIMAYIGSKPITKREYVENTKFIQLPKSIQKKVGSEENWLKMSYDEKKTIFNPYEKKFRGDKIKVMKFGYIKLDNFTSYAKFIDKDYKPNITGKTYAPDKFTDEFNDIAEAITQKAKDIEMQREEMSQQYEKAMQTSFGDTNLENDLKKDHGVFIKKQDGKKLSLDEKEQLGKSLNLIKSVFGDKKQMSESFGLKIVHSGTKQIFASKAIGLYSPTFKSISVSSKYGDSKFGFTLAHEYSHFFDNYIGDKNGRRFASDDYNSTAGKIAKEFRKNMNKTSDSNYINRTCECFARAFEQYFAHKTEGADVIKIDSKYTDHPDHVNYSKFKEKIEPLIDQFLKENDKLLKSINIMFNEDQFILDLIKAQDQYKGDPSHGGKLVKKQIIDKNGHKQTEWVRPEDFNKPINKDKKQDQSKDQNQSNQQDEKPNTDFIDNLANEDKAKLELIKEMIDSGDHINAKQLADGLSDEVKHFIPKDVWKDLHIQEQIETNGVKVEEEDSSVKKKDEDKYIDGIEYSRADNDRGLNNVSDFQNENYRDTVQEYIEGLTGGKGNNTNSRYIYTNRKINGKKVLFRIANHSHSSKNVDDNTYLISILVNRNDSDRYDEKDRHSYDEDYAEIELYVDENNIEDKLYNFRDYLDDINADFKDKKVKKSQMNIFQQGKQLINKAIDNVKDFFNPNVTIQEFADTIVFNNNFDILLLKRSSNVLIEPNKWWLPGGHLDEGEEPIVGAYRELMEETGVNPDFKEFNKIDTISNANRLVHYYTTFLSNNNVVLDLDEHSEYKWVSVYDLRKYKLAFNQLDILVDVVLKAKQVMSYCILKEAFNQGKLSEDEFLKILQSKNIKE